MQQGYIMYPHAEIVQVRGLLRAKEAPPLLTLEVLKSILWHFYDKQHWLRASAHQYDWAVNLNL